MQQIADEVIFEGPLFRLSSALGGLLKHQIHKCLCQARRHSFAVRRLADQHISMLVIKLQWDTQMCMLMPEHTAAKQVLAAAGDDFAVLIDHGDRSMQ